MKMSINTLTNVSYNSWFCFLHHKFVFSLQEESEEEAPDQSGLVTPAET